jgi:hypothetical protein
MHLFHTPLQRRAVCHCCCGDRSQCQHHRPTSRALLPKRGRGVGPDPVALAHSGRQVVSGSGGGGGPPREAWRPATPPFRAPSHSAVAAHTRVWLARPRSRPSSQCDRMNRCMRFIKPRLVAERLHEALHVLHHAAQHLHWALRHGLAIGAARVLGLRLGFGGGHQLGAMPTHIGSVAERVTVLERVRV